MVDEGHPSVVDVYELLGQREGVELHQGLRARTITDQKPSCTRWLSVIVTSTKPVPVSRWLYRCRVRAPAMQSVHAFGSACSAAAGSRSAATSAMASRPRERRTRKVSANTLSLSGERLMTQLESTTSTLVSGSGISSI